MAFENGWTDEVARNSGTNSSPVLSVSNDDVLTYANAASWIVLKTWGASLSRTIPPALQSVIDEARRTGCTQDRTLVAGLVSVHLVFVPLAGDGSVLILGADTTASRQSDKDRLIKAHVYMQVREAIVVMDDEFRTIDLNPAYLRLTDQTEAEVLGEPPQFLSRARRQASLYSEIVENLTEAGSWQGEISERTDGGDQRTISVSISAIRTSGLQVTHFVALVTDITYRQRAEAQLHKMAHFDGLTGLPNRYLFADHLQAALSHSKRTGEKFAVMLVDLDGFKSINDSFGHRAGDGLLQTVSAAMAGVVRASDTVARFGGDEFAVIARDLKTPEAGTVVGRKLLGAISRITVIDGYEIYVTGSIGIALFPADGTDIETLIRKADAAMYRVKRTAKNDLRYAVPDHGNNTARNLQIQTSLRRAILAEEIEVAFQPQISSTTRSMVGIEALARWHDAVLGDVPPLSFVGVAETFGLIDELGEVVLRKACLQGAAWSAEYGRPIRISVNVSPRQLRNRSFVSTVERILEETGYPATSLELELTETVFVDDTESLMSTFDQLAALGVEFCVDDFGTKYASLMYVKQFPISRIKIDRSFVQDLPDDTSSGTLVTAIIEMARSLGCTVVAEGVERVEQWRFLRRAGCEEIQGYLCGRPMNAVALRSMIEHGCTLDVPDVGT